MKKNKWVSIVVVAAALGGLFLLNYITTERRSVSEKMLNLFSNHRGAVVLVRSGTDLDREFIDAVREARSKLRGAAGIIFARPDDGFVGPDEEPPVLMVFDPHGVPITRMVGVLDRQALHDAVHQIVAHSCGH